MTVAAFDVSTLLSQAGWTPLHIAASAGRTDIVRALLGKGAQLNSTNQVGCTPLHYAASKNKHEVTLTWFVHMQKSSSNLFSWDSLFPSVFNTSYMILMLPLHRLLLCFWKMELLLMLRTSWTAPHFTVQLQKAT